VTLEVLTSLNVQISVFLDVTCLYSVDGTNVEEELVASIFQIGYCCYSALRCR